VVFPRWQGTRLGAGTFDAQQPTLGGASFVEDLGRPCVRADPEVPQELTVPVVCPNEFSRLGMLRVVVLPMSPRLGHRGRSTYGNQVSLVELAESAVHPLGHQDHPLPCVGALPLPTVPVVPARVNAAFTMLLMR
jgi:hypothetical protein